eukprot:scaffold13321_cov193-Alexandrium_tamarense.AAC.11
MEMTKDAAKGGQDIRLQCSSRLECLRRLRLPFSSELSIEVGTNMLCTITNPTNLHSSVRKNPTPTCSTRLSCPSIKIPSSSITFSHHPLTVVIAQSYRQQQHQPRCINVRDMREIGLDTDFDSNVLFTMMSVA